MWRWKLCFQYVLCFYSKQGFCSNISNIFYSISPTIVLLFLSMLNIIRAVKSKMIISYIQQFPFYQI